MLRITVHDNPRSLTFQLEGSLAGPWLRELEECWRNALADPHQPVLRVDLTGVTSINAAGKAFLAALHRKGAEFVAADCLTKAIVAEITHGSEVRSQKSEVRSQKSEVRSQRSEVRSQRSEVRGRRSADRGRDFQP